MSLEKRPENQNMNPEHHSIVRREKAELAIPDSVREAGFSSSLADRLKQLNDVLVNIAPPRAIGFNLEIMPDAKNPTIDFKAAIRNPFKMELMGGNLTAPGISEFAIRVTEIEGVGAYLDFNDLQDFTKKAFPGKRITLYIEPKGFMEDGIKRDALWLRARRVEADSLYGEETSREFQSAQKWNRSLIEEGLLEKGILIIEGDLSAIREEDLIMLTKIAPEYRFPEIRMEGQRDSVLDLYIPNVFGDNADFRIGKFYFRGKPQEVVDVIGQFTTLMKKVHKYPDRRQDGGKTLPRIIKTVTTTIALPQPADKQTLEEFLKRRGLNEPT